MPNYDFTDLEGRAAAALEHHRDLVAGMESAYVKQRSVRSANAIPAICLVGMGRAGKDTAAEFLSAAFNLKTPKSSSLNAAPLVAHMAGERNLDAFYAERHQHRLFWIAACHALREGDLARLARWCLGTGDFAIGLRGKAEFEHVSRKVVDLTVWIDNNRVPTDPTTEFSKDECDVVIENHWSLEQFHERLVRFGRVAYPHRQ